MIWLIIGNVLFDLAIVYFVVFYQRRQAILLRELLALNVEKKRNAWEIDTERVNAVVLDRALARRAMNETKLWPEVPWERRAPWERQITLPTR